jgi:hypothetical protein
VCGGVAYGDWTAPPIDEGLADTRKPNTTVSSVQGVELQPRQRE